LGSTIKPDDSRKIEAIFMAYEADAGNWSSGPAVIHSDFKPAHVLFDAEVGQITGVLDWGDAALGDPDYDFACVKIFFGDDFFDRLLAGGTSSDKVRIERKAPFLTLVRALQDLMLYVIDEDRGLIKAALRRVELQLRQFDAHGGIV
jgi:aminoglycoside 2''-phosphotransferase